MTDSNSPADRDRAFVTVVFAEDYTEAEYFKSLLEDHGIEVRMGDGVEGVEGVAAVDDNASENRGQGIPITVMYENLADAENIIDRVNEAEEEFDVDADHDDSEEDEFADFGEIDPDEL